MKLILPVQPSPADSSHLTAHTPSLLTLLSGLQKVHQDNPDTRGVQRQNTTG